MILGLCFEGLGAHLVHVDEPGLLADPVVEEGVAPAREVDGVAVSEMAAVGQAHGQHGVTRLERRPVDGLVGRGPGVRLHVGVLGAEEVLGPLDGQRLDLVHHFAPAVVAVAGVAFGVLVGEHAPHGLEHRDRREVLGRDELDVVLLARELPADERSTRGSTCCRGRSA